MVKTEERPCFFTPGIQFRVERDNGISFTLFVFNKAGQGDMALDPKIDIVNHGKPFDVEIPKSKSYGALLTWARKYIKSLD